MEGAHKYHAVQPGTQTMASARIQLYTVITQDVVEQAGKEGEQEGLEDEEGRVVVGRPRCQPDFYCAGIHRDGYRYVLNRSMRGLVN